MEVKMLDKLGQRLLQELQKDGRQSYRELGRKLGTVEGTIRKRVRDMRDKKVMKIAAVPDPGRLGYNFICTMGLEVKLADLQQVGEKLAKCRNVYYLAHVTGHFDLMAILIFRTAQELADFIRDNISVMPSITRTETFVNMTIVKSPWAEALDVAALLSGEER